MVYTEDFGAVSFSIFALALSKLAFDAETSTLMAGDNSAWRSWRIILMPVLRPKTNSPWWADFNSSRTGP